MSVPSMESSNVLAQIMRQVIQLQTDFAAFRSASGTLDAATIYKGGLTVIDSESNRRMLLTDAGIRFWHDFSSAPELFGAVEPSGGTIGLIIYPPHTSGEFFANSISLQGHSEFGTGGVFIDADGLIQITAQQTLSLNGDTVYVTGDQLTIFDLPTTGSAANVRQDPSTEQLFAVVSSRRYKEDIADAVIDTDEVLQLQPRTWVDKGTAERMADSGDVGDIPRNVGFIAEELDELPSMRQFVDYIELDGQRVPNGIQYDRLAVGLVELAKTQQTQLDAQASAIADLTARLEALENA